MCLAAIDRKMTQVFLVLLLAVASTIANGIIDKIMTSKYQSTN